MYPCLASSGLDMPLDFALDFPLDFALDGCDFGVISQIKELNPLIVTDSALLKSANVGRPIPQRTIRSFNGTTQYIDLGVGDPLGLDGSNRIDVEVEVDLKAKGSTGTMFSQSLSESTKVGFTLVRLSSGAIRVAGRSDSIDAFQSFSYPSPTPLGWHNIRAYIDYGIGEFGISIDKGAYETSSVSFLNNFFNFGELTPTEVATIASGGSTGFNFLGSIAYVNIVGKSIYELAENGGTVARDSLGNTDGTNINNPVVTTDNTFTGSDPLNERGFTEGTGSNGAAIGEYLVARLDTPSIDVGGNPTQWANTAYPVLPNITGGTVEAFTALNTNVADDGNQTPAIRRAGLPATWTQGDANVPRFQTKDNGDSTSSLALGLPADPTPTEQISIDKYHE